MKALIVLLLIFVVACATPPEDAARANIQDIQRVQDTIVETSEMNKYIQKVAVSPELSFFEFEGYGPGKSHVGTFDVGEAFFIYENNQLVGFEGIIEADSFNTGIGGLDNHLMSDDFFDVENFPDINAVSTSIGKGEITGDLTFHGITKEITFPATITDKSVEADFLLDTTPFNIKYTAINKEVRIAFKFVIE